MPGLRGPTLSCWPWPGPFSPGTLGLRRALNRPRYQHRFPAWFPLLVVVVKGRENLFLLIVGSAKAALARAVTETSLLSITTRRSPVDRQTVPEPLSQDADIPAPVFSW